MPNAAYFVAAAGEAIVGFYGLVPRPPEPDLLFVAGQARGLGVGAALWRTCSIKPRPGE